MSLPLCKTRIVCTIGPASQSREVMERMLRSGMNIARLNFSHGDFAGHRRVIADLRAAADATGRRLTIMADLPGPKIRIGEFAEEPVELRHGDRFTLTTEDIVGDASRVSVTFAGLPAAAHAGDTLYLNDGLIQLCVEAVEGRDVHCRVVLGGELRSRKGLNLPDVDLGISAFTDHDRDCLRFALEHGVDAVSQSFVEQAADIHAVRQAAADLGHHPFIIAKIERSRALLDLPGIIEAADGVMVARGDLGVELPIERMAVVQKEIMRKANMRGRPVITATQMLESMTSNRRPTRAEATDVANAILDGTDCVMLSGESAMGKFPVEAVEMLGKIAAAIEPQRSTLSPRQIFAERDGELPLADLVGIGVETVLEYTDPAAVFVPTVSGRSVRMIARFRFPEWIVAVSPHEKTCRALQFTAGVCAVHEAEAPDDWNGYIRRWLKENDVSGDRVMLVEGPSSRRPDANHRLEIVSL